MPIFGSKVKWFLSILMYGVPQSSSFSNIFYNLFLEEGKGGRKKGRETSMGQRYIDQLPLAHPQLGSWPQPTTEN